MWGRRHSPETTSFSWIHGKRHPLQWRVPRVVPDDSPSADDHSASAFLYIVLFMSPNLSGRAGPPPVQGRQYLCTMKSLGFPGLSFVDLVSSGKRLLIYKLLSVAVRQKPGRGGRYEGERHGCKYFH